MKKTGKVKKFANGGLMGAIARMRGGPSKGEMAKMSIAEQVAKMPRGGMEAMAEEMAKADVPRGGFLSGMKTKPMRVGERMDASTAKLLAGSAPSASVSEVSNFMRKPGRVAEVFDELPMRKPGRVAEVFDELPMREPGRMRDIFKTTFKKGGKVENASRRGDGIAQRGKTKGRMI